MKKILPLILLALIPHICFAQFGSGPFGSGGGSGSGSAAVSAGAIGELAIYTGTTVVGGSTVASCTTSGCTFAGTGSSSLGIVGSSTGKTILATGLTGSTNNTITFPAAAGSTDTVDYLGTAQTFTGVKTFSANPIGPGGGNINYVKLSFGGSNTTGTAIPTGTTGYGFSLTGGTIISATIIGSLSAGTCSAVVDIWKSNAAVPTVSNTITASALPTLSSATYHQDTTLTAWTTTIAANDVLLGNLNSNTCDRLTVILGVKQ